MTVISQDQGGDVIEFDPDDTGPAPIEASTPTPEILDEGPVIPDDDFAEDAATADTTPVTEEPVEEGPVVPDAD